MKKGLGLMLTAIVLVVALLPAAAMACTKTLEEVRDADGDGIIEVGERVEFDIVIHVENYWEETAYNVRLYDRFGAELEVVGFAITDGSQHADDPLFYTKGKSEKVFLFWNIGEHEPGEFAEITITMATDLNPAGKQEYTSPGCNYYLNSGATVKKVYSGVQYSWETPPLPISVVEPD